MAKSKTSRAIARSAGSGSFTLGRHAFTKVSKVEGIVVSGRLKEDLRRLSNAPHEKRRGVLAQKYGKK